MKRVSLFLVIALLTVLLPAQKMLKKPVPAVQYLQYEVEEFDSQAWIVTAREVESGERFRFRLPPTVFKGQTFMLESDSVKPGQSFRVRGPRNVRLGNMVMDRPLPMARVEATEGKELGRRHATRVAADEMQPLRLAWVILSLDPRNFVVTAQNEKTRQVIRFSVNPQCFKGLRFLADAANLASGMAFSIIVPNEEAFSGCCTLME